MAARQIVVVATDDQSKSVTVAVDGHRYEYELGDAYYCARDQLRRLRRAPGRQLNWLKRRGRLVRGQGNGSS